MKTVDANTGILLIFGLGFSIYQGIRQRQREDREWQRERKRDKQLNDIISSITAMQSSITTMQSSITTIQMFLPGMGVDFWNKDWDSVGGAIPARPTNHRRKVAEYYGCIVDSSAPNEEGPTNHHVA